MKEFTIECRQIVSDGTTNNSTPGLSAIANWLDFCDLAYDDDATEKLHFVQTLERHQPDIVELAASLIEDGQVQPIQVRRLSGAGKNRTFSIVAGRRRFLAVLYNACRIAAPIARIRAVEAGEEVSMTLKVSIPHS